MTYGLMAHEPSGEIYLAEWGEEWEPFSGIIGPLDADDLDIVQQVGGEEYYNRCRINVAIDDMRGDIAWAATQDWGLVEREYGVPDDVIAMGGRPYGY